MLGGYTCGLGSQTVWLQTLALLPTNWEAVNFSLPQFPLIQLVLASIILSITLLQFQIVQHGPHVKYSFSSAGHI